MASEEVRVIPGRVLHVAGTSVWLSLGRHLFESTDSGLSWHRRAVLDTRGGCERLTPLRLGRRVARVGFHHFHPIGPSSAVAVAHSHIFRFASSARCLERMASVVGSRPLAFSAAQGILCYGEYRRNPERSSVHVWGSTVTDLKAWSPLWRFDGVRHVHGVFFDQYASAFWVTTGDSDSESSIWITTDKFRTLDRVTGGSQKHRAVQLLFSESYVYFGSDAPDQINHIYRLDRQNGSIEPLSTVDGPVFYGWKVGNYHFFATVVEPSSEKRSRYAEIWSSADGYNWTAVRRFRKDFWPMRQFQYGQILFPSGPGDGVYLWCTPMATELDQQTLRVPLSVLSR